MVGGVYDLYNWWKIGLVTMVLKYVWNWCENLTVMPLYLFPAESVEQLKTKQELEVILQSVVLNYDHKGNHCFR